jgi:hypothetical protein
MVETLDGKFGFHDRDGRYWRCFLYIKDSITLKVLKLLSRPMKEEEASASSWPG